MRKKYVWRRMVECRVEIWRWSNWQPQDCQIRGTRSTWSGNSTEEPDPFPQFLETKKPKIFHERSKAKNVKFHLKNSYRKQSALIQKWRKTRTRTSSPFSEPLWQYLWLSDSPPRKTHRYRIKKKNDAISFIGWRINRPVYRYRPSLRWHCLLCDS